MKTYFIYGCILILSFLSSCGTTRKPNSKDSHAYMDYKKMIFHNEEYTTFVSLSKLQDTLIEDSVRKGTCLLRGTVYVRWHELDGNITCPEQLKFGKYDYTGGWPHLIIPELDINFEITQSTFSVEIPAGTFNVILIANDYYPIHRKWTFRDQHIVTLDCYMGCTVLH